jgi:putative flavoprotein involved in K+ transport
LLRRYRGRDALEWLHESGQLDLPRAHAEPGMITATPPQVSGAGGGCTVSYQDLASRGATLLGRGDGRRLDLALDLGDNVPYADDVSDFVRAAWEKRARLTSRGLADVADHDPADARVPNLYALSRPTSLDLAAVNISTVIWATGFGPSLGWLPTAALDVHHRPQLPGLYVIGAPWLTHRSSANLYGMAADAERLVSILADVRLSAAA